MGHIGIGLALADLAQLLGELRRGRVDSRQFRAQRHARGAGERRQVDQQLGLFAIGFGERIGEHQPAFGVGVADLDRESLARTQDVARPEGAARDASSPPPESAGAAARARPRP